MEIDEETERHVKIECDKLSNHVAATIHRFLKARDVSAKGVSLYACVRCLRASPSLMLSQPLQQASQNRMLKWKFARSWLLCDWRFC